MAAANGAPEGDPFSCAIICAACWLLAHLIEQPALQARLYVDNWSWTGSEAEEVARALHTTQRLTRSLRMSIDWAKTYAWAAGSASQAELKEALLETAGAPCVVPVVSATVELGVSFVFDMGRHTHQLQARLQKALQRLGRLRTDAYPIQSKAHRLQTSVWPVAFYGMEAQVVPKRQVQQLRTAASRALLGNTSIASPLLVLSLVSPALQDPQVYLTVQAFRAFRRLVAQDFVLAQAV
jgi:hypothetical protein